MKTSMRRLQVFVWMLLMSPCLDAAMDLGDYQIILDKQLLGSTQQITTPAVAPPPTVATPAWSREYRMTMMTKDQSTGSIRVGLQHVQNQSAVLLIEGRDRHEDFKLVSANYAQRSAQISYRGVIHRFDLREGTAPSAAPRPSPVLQQPAPRGSARFSPRSQTGNATRNRNVPRREEAPALQIRRFASQEELQEHLKQQQMDAIRTGKPPLPIPLTPAMDQQLVQEGVLPPQAEQ